MASGDGSDLVAMVAAEIAKQLPLKETLTPAGTEIGALGSDLAKCVRLALAPIQYLAVQQDRYRRFIEASATRVAPENRVQPAPQLLGPILEGIRYEPQGSISDQAFSELLSRAFDRERVGQAHPAFPGVIRALSDDELQLVERLRKGPLKILMGYQQDGFDASVTKLPPEIHRERFSYLAYPELILAAAAHIEALGLVHTMMPSQEGTVQEGPYQGFVRWYWTMDLSDFGELFASAILKDPVN